MLQFHFGDCIDLLEHVSYRGYDSLDNTIDRLVFGSGFTIATTDFISVNSSFFHTVAV